MGFWRDIKDSLKWAKDSVKWALTPLEQKQNLLEQAVGILRLDPETSTLYDQALRDGVAISFDKWMIGDWAGGIFGFEREGEKPYIRLKPRENVDEIATILAHELRHHWQYKTLGMSPGQWQAQRLGGGKLSLVFNRVIEADAYAFQQRFCHIVSEHTRLTQDMARLLERQREQNGVLTQDHIATVNKIAAEEWKTIRAGAGLVMTGHFHDYLFSDKLVKNYDIPLALYIHELSINPAANDNIPAAPLASVATLRKAFRNENLRPFRAVEQVGDDAFNAEVLRHVHDEAGTLVWLTGEFKAAREAKKPEAEMLRNAAKNIAMRLGK